MDFYVDFNFEVPNVQEKISHVAERQLRELAAGHTDLVGAAVFLESIVKTETQYLYEVRIVVYKQPEDIAVIQKDTKPMIALNQALITLERIVRASREKLAQDESHRSEGVEADQVLFVTQKNTDAGEG